MCKAAGSVHDNTIVVWIRSCLMRTQLKCILNLSYLAITSETQAVGEAAEVVAPTELASVVVARVGKAVVGTAVVVARVGEAGVEAAVVAARVGEAVVVVADGRLLREEPVALVAFCVDRLADRRGRGPLCAD